MFQNVVHSSAATTTMHKSYKHQSCFDGNGEGIQRLLGEKHRLHNAHQDDTTSVSKQAAYGYISKTVQNRLSDMEHSWPTKKAKEI